MTNTVKRDIKETLVVIVAVTAVTDVAVADIAQST